MHKYTRVAVLAAVFSILSFGFVTNVAAQVADDPYVGPTPSVAPETTELVPSAVAPSESSAVAPSASQVSPAATTAVEGESLALTGGDVTALVVLGLVLVGGGALFLTARRRTALPA